MLRPKKTSYKKSFKPKKKVLYEQRSVLPQYGVYGIKALEGGLVTEKQMQACVNVMRKLLKKKGSFFLTVRPLHSFTSKPNESRMGKGKGAVDYWVAKVGKGKIIFEFSVTRKASMQLVNLVFKNVNERLGIPLKLVLLKT